MVPAAAELSGHDPDVPEWESLTPDALTELDHRGVELYHVGEDFAENHNVAAEHRYKLIEMIATWYVEAGRYDVLPIDGSGLVRLME